MEKAVDLRDKQKINKREMERRILTYAEHKKREEEQRKNID